MAKWRVKLEGAEPYHTNKDQACADLWVSRFTGADCAISCAADPGAIHAKNLKLSAFANVPKQVQKLVFDQISGIKAQQLIGMCNEVQTVSPTIARKPHIGIQIEPLECWIETTLGGLGGKVPVTSYTVGVVSDDFHVLLETKNPIEAVVKLASASFELEARKKLLAA
jgi:hypothetical protein